MSESTSEDFSDSDSDVGQDEKPIEKIATENKDEVATQVSDDNNVETDSSDEEEAEQAPKKRKTLQDYLIEKVG